MPPVRDDDEDIEEEPFDPNKPPEPPDTLDFFDWQRSIGKLIECLMGFAMGHLRLIASLLRCLYVALRL